MHPEIRIGNRLIIWRR